MTSVRSAKTIPDAKNQTHLLGTTKKNEKKPPNPVGVHRERSSLALIACYGVHLKMIQHGNHQVGSTVEHLKSPDRSPIWLRLHACRQLTDLVAGNGGTSAPWDRTTASNQVPKSG
jgi:hypothetical protein